MGSLNRVMLIGNLGRDAELRHTQAGTPVAGFSIATSETYTDKDGQKQEKTEWHRVVLWGKVADAIGKYLVRGKQVYVEGRLKTRQWNDKQGNARYTTEVNADQIVLLGGVARSEPEQAVAGAADVDDDQIPF